MSVPRSLVALGAAALLSGCATFPIPKDYVPDSQVVYLVQRTGFGPIRYPAVAADPYTFAPDLSEVNAETPQFLKNLTWEGLLRADYRADSLLYREVAAHLTRAGESLLFRDLRARLDAAVIVPPEALPPVTGDRLKEYSNGGLYDYPGAPGARITVLQDGYYEIVFADKGHFRFQADGSYERVDGQGKVIFASNPRSSYAVATVDGFTLTSTAQHREIAGPQGRLAYTEDPHPQYQFTPGSGPTGPSYTFFVDEQRQVLSTALFLKSELRIDYFSAKTATTDEGVLVTKGDQAVFLGKDYQKTHQRFDSKQKKATDVLSLYFPEGLRLTNLAGPGPAYSEVRAAWPEKYKSKVLGPFEVLYTAKDESVVAKLRADKLTAIEAADRRQTGLAARERRTLVIPPDLEAYRKLAAAKPGDVFHWYPSGFETKDIIVMWPVSVPRYDSPLGQKYFLEEEFYQILTHEYVHVLVGENSGLASPLPVWLNEGLAVYVETLASPEAKAYWDLTFEVSQGLGRLLSWDTVTTTSTGDLDIAKARVHYAQSYALVKALQQKFGTAKVAEYVKSFRVAPGDVGKVDLLTIYKTRFQAVFGVPFDRSLVDALLPPPKR